jgi:hypothetical protein
MKKPSTKTMPTLIRVAVMMFISIGFSLAQAEIVFLAPSPSQVPPGALIANAPGISYSSTPAGYMLQRSQAWKLQNKNSTPGAQNYWLVLPGTSGAMGYSYSNGRYMEPTSERAATTRAHVARANAYRMKLFER